MGNVSRHSRGAGREPGKAKRSDSIGGERLRLNIQATSVELNWDNPNDHNTLPGRERPVVVTLSVHTSLPDEYVIAVVEELQRQQGAHPGALPEVFIRMEVERGPIIEGKLSVGPPALPDKKKGLPG